MAAELFRTTILENTFPDTTWQQMFQNVSSEVDFWDYMVNVIPTFLFKDDVGDKNYVYQVNRMVQPTRIRQVRVVSEPPAACPVPVPPRLRKFISACYPAAGPGAVDTAPIPGWPPGASIPYRTGAELGTARSWLGVFPYDGGGHAADIPLNATSSDVVARLRHWRAARWTDRHTRAVVVNFVVYNPVNRFFLSATLLFEFLPYGRVLPTHSFRVMRLGLTGRADYAALALDSVVCVGFLLLAARDAAQLIRLGPRNYSHDPWRAVNWAVFAIFLVGLAFKFQFLLPAFRVAATPAAAAGFVDFEALGWTASQLWNWTSFSSVLLWLRALGYVRLTTDRVAGQLHAVLGSALRCGAAFAVLSLLVLAFGLALHLAFGADLPSQRSPQARAAPPSPSTDGDHA